MKYNMTGLNIKQAALDAFEGSASAQLKISPSEHKKTLIAQLKKWSDPKSGEFLSGFRHEEFISLDFKKTIQTVKVFRKQFKRLLVLGTGGSSLGSKAILQALKAKCDREIIFIENLDCNEIPNLKSSELKQTGVIAISKSGSTLETLLALSYFEKLYKKNSLKISKHFAAISDAHASADLSTQNMLRSWATVRGCTILDMHPSIGGRWSVSTAVGIFPLAFAGLNAQKFLSALCKSFKSGPSDETLQLALRLLDYEENGYSVHAQFNYASSLKELGAWWRQLWSESLGKKSGSLTKGSFALPCLGAVDQHSVLQQLAEGHRQVITGFIRVSDTTGYSKIKKIKAQLAPEFSKLSFAQSKNWNEILLAQATATEKSLQNEGRPTYSLEIKKINEESLGELMAFWMDLIALMGAGLRVNPFDQPGVEKGKTILKEILK